MHEGSRSGRLLRRSILLGVVVSAAVTDAPADGAIRSRVIASSDFVALIEAAAAGEPDVALSDVRIEGIVDLTPLRVVERPVRCERCSFSDEVLVADVDFRRPVEFVRSSFERGFVATGTDFEAGAAFDESNLSSIDFTGASFGALASFDRVNIEDFATFRRTTFGDSVNFTAAADRSPGADRPCGDVNGRTGGDVDFRNAQFAADADFRHRCFGGSVDFSSARLGGDTDFGLISAFGTAVFDQVDSTGRWSFANARFHDTVSFRGATIGDLLVLTSVRFVDLGDRDVVGADFQRVAGTGRLVLDPTFHTRYRMSDLEVPLVAPWEVARTTVGPDVQTAVLRNVERTARSDGRLDDANDALYEIRRRAGDDERSWIGRRADDVHRYLFGYFVRPARPLLWLLGLVALGTLVRLASRLVPDGRPSLVDRTFDTPAGGTRRLTAAALGSAGDATHAVWRRTPAWTSTSPEGGERPMAGVVRVTSVLEWSASKVLLAVWLVSLTNVNATLKELVDALS